MVLGVVLEPPEAKEEGIMEWYEWMILVIVGLTLGIIQTVALILLKIQQAVLNFLLEFVEWH